LNSPPAYILATEDPGQITDNNVVGNGSFSSGVISPMRDVSQALVINTNNSVASIRLFEP